MKNRYFKKVLAGALAAGMVVSMAGCGDSGTSGTARTDDAKTTDGKSEEPVTLTVWNTEVLTPGVQDNAVAKVFEEKLGVKLDIIQGDSQKFSVLMAGGDLPDIIYSNYAQQGVDYASLISSGQLLALDDLIDQYGENIKKNGAERLEYSKKFASNGEDKTYFIPVLSYTKDEENPDISYSIENVGLMTRWDV